MTRPHIPHVPLQETFGFIIHRISHGMRAMLMKHLEPMDLTPEQWVLIRALIEKDGITHAELSEDIFKDRAFVTRIIDRLAERGLVSREPNPADRRSSLVVLTDEGRAFDEDAVSIASDLFAKMFAGLNHKDIDTLMRTLSTVRDNIEQCCSENELNCKGMDQ